MKKFLSFIICALAVLTSGSVATVFTLQLTGTINVFADEVNVEFRNYDNTFLWSDRVPVGSTVIYEGNTPTREGSDEFDYTFVSWDKSLSNVVMDTVYHAQFQRKPKQCTVSFKNYNSKLLYQTEVVKGGTAVFIGATPIRESDNQYSYKFIGWDKPLDNITEDTVITAQYEELALEYEIRFLNYDDSLLYVDHVAKGGEAVYRGIAPTRPDDDKKDYTFIGWDHSLENITYHFSTKAQYQEEDVLYDVTFINYDGTELYVDHVPFNKDADYRGPTPLKPPSGQYQFVFKEWSQDITNITSNLTVVATFSVEEREITTKFCNYDGSILYIATSKYNRPAIYKGEMPTKPDDEKYSYFFDKWDRDLSNMTEDTVTYPIFTKELRKFECKFLNNDGSVIYVTKVKWGETAVYMGPTPTFKGGDPALSYRFLGWDKDLHDIKEDSEFTAQYEEYGGGGSGIEPNVTVYFYDYDGTILDGYVGEEGEPAEYLGKKIGTEIVHNDWVFYGWSLSKVYMGGAHYLGIYQDPFLNLQEDLFPYFAFALYKTGSGNFVISYLNSYFEPLYLDIISPNNSTTYYGIYYDYLSIENGFIGWNVYPYANNSISSDNTIENVSEPMTLFPQYSNYA